MRPPTTEAYETAIQEISDLHGNMAVLSKLDGLLKDENSNLDDIEKLLQTDGALSASVVKISNKAVFGFASERESLSEALQSVGFAQTLKLVSSALSKQVFMRDLEAYGISADAYWKYSYFAAAFMENQAKHLGIDSSAAYLLGLLHSIGRVVVNELLHRNQIEVYWDRFVSPDQWEIETIGFSSERAGALLLKNWKFSEEFCSKVERQAIPPTETDDILSQLLDYTRAIAVNLEDHDRIEQLIADDSHPIHAKLGRSADQIIEDIQETKRMVKNISKSLEGL